MLADRQVLLQQSLSPDQPVFAYLGPPELSIEAIIQVDVANVLNLPVEILGFDNMAERWYLKADVLSPDNVFATFQRAQFYFSKNLYSFPAT